MTASQPTETGPRDRLVQVGKPQVAPTVTLSGQRQDGVRPYIDAPVDTPREVNSEEGVPRVRDRVDEPFYQVLTGGHEPVVLAAERDDGWVRDVPCQSCHSVTLQTGTQHDSISAYAAASREDPAPDR